MSHGESETGGLAELKEELRLRLVAGFWDYDDLLEWASDSEGVRPADAAVLLRSMWDQRLAEQADWPDTGDYGRLEDTFTQLQSEGILARMCFSCCVTCATSEIDHERTLHPDPPDWYRYREWAYTYFHEQDALRLGESPPQLVLGYSAFRAHPDLPEALVRASYDGDAAAADEVKERTDTMVGQRIVAVAESFGLTTYWSGSRHERIEVQIDQWRKPLPPRLAQEATRNRPAPMRWLGSLLKPRGGTS
ncbi:hypothetical protein A5742_21920 [Mycolicibacterium fortuitum]|uniref:DUF6891 domain-containing protein n=1 Tax=Mycolicibacterium fortuitum TaxID=1766 RepID=A0ABD6QQV4_MYCFO|nr:hypothetical protein [Mycolicibacterium fortuitum]OMC48638.1 hypothetical protein A5742_21920 [Mycolicibacterium fortuitum]